MDAKFLPLFVVMPMASAFLIPLFAKVWVRFADLIANAAGAVLVGLSVYGAIYLFTDSQVLLYHMGGWASSLGITLAYDHLTALVALAVNVVGLAAMLFSVRYLDHYTGR